MAYMYKHFIPQNTAPSGSKSIGVYNSTGEKIYNISLGLLTPKAGTPLYTFALISDLHVYKIETSWNGNRKFDNSLTFFEEKGCLFCAHCGDITQTGLYFEGDKVNLAPEQFEMYKSICDKHTIPVYGICGNHESSVVPITNNLTELKYYTGTDLYYTKTQGNDLYIFIGQPSWNDVMGDDALQWLYETLETNRNKRCFVFIHPYLEEDSGDPLDLRENSIFETWGTVKTTVFKSLMKHYKNVVLIHGHSHMKYGLQELDKTTNYTDKNGFKSVHVSSVGKPRDIDLENATTPEDPSASQGYTVDVYEDCIVFNGWNLIDKEYIPLGVLKIETPLVNIEAGTFTDSTGTIVT